MHTFLAIAVALINLNAPFIENPINSLNHSVVADQVQLMEKEDNQIQNEHSSQELRQMLFDYLGLDMMKNSWEEIPDAAIKNLKHGDLILCGYSEDEIQTIGIYLENDQFVCATKGEDSTIQIKRYTDSEWENFQLFPYKSVRSNQVEVNLAENSSLEVKNTLPVLEIKTPLPGNSSFLEEKFNCYFVNEQHMPLVISPRDPNITLSSFQEWALGHQEELKSFLTTEGALLLRDFPVEKAEDFGSVIKSIIGSNLLDYRGGEGSRTKVAEGVYTSTEAPPQFHIPLHNELSCTNHPATYICFYCDIAPEPGTGQTLIGLTESITQEMLNHPYIWNFFNGHKIRYISRHPPEGSFFNKINVTHKTWPQVFETKDKSEVERICKEKGLEYKWLGDWIEVSRLVPAIKDPDQYFDHPYWFNQSYLYHGNPRIRGGWINHIMANLLYINPSTRQYDVELEDGTPIPMRIVYGIYDILAQHEIKFDWQKRDVLVLDNIKALHGRAPTGGKRRILAAMVP
jgi:hypothetical protein